MINKIRPTHIIFLISLCIVFVLSLWFTQSIPAYQETATVHHKLKSEHSQLYHDIGEHKTDIAERDATDKRMTDAWKEAESMHRSGIVQLTLEYAKKKLHFNNTTRLNVLGSLEKEYAELCAKAESLGIQAQPSDVILSSEDKIVAFLEYANKMDLQKPNNEDVSTCLNLLTDIGLSQLVEKAATETTQGQQKQDTTGSHSLSFYINKLNNSGHDCDSGAINSLTKLLELIRKGAPVDSILPEDDTNSTALIRASALGQVGLVHWLLKNGANPDAKTASGTNAEWCAESARGIEIRNLIKAYRQKKALSM